MFDIAIIGCGVVGALTARELSRYDLKICILEKESDVAMGASGANSGISHAGHDALENTLKAMFNVLGNALMPKITKELGVKYKNNGSLVIGFNDADKAHLEKLYERGLNNGVEGLEIIDRDTLVKLEPKIADNAISALWAKSGGIVCPYGLCIAACGNAIDNGATLKTDFEVVNISHSVKSGFTIQSAFGEKIEAKIVINCAGIYSDRIAGLIGDRSFKMGARKGEYVLLDRELKPSVSTTIFSCPSEKGKGILVTPTVSGNLMIGPTSIETSDREDNSINSDRFDFIANNAKNLVKDLPLNTTITSFCGIRAFSDRHDFIIEKSKINPKFINVAGIESPGLVSSPAIAVYAAELALSELKNLKVNPSFNPNREPDTFFKSLSVEQKNELIAKNPAYGKIVCRCEEVTLGEILHSISKNPIPKTLDAIKRRTRAGMGRCQSGFCQPYIISALAKELNIEPEAITKSGGNSYILTGKIK